MRDPRASAERIDQVVALTRKLEDRILLDTPSAWADCRVLALEILELVDDEEGSRTARTDPPEPMNREVVQRLLEAISACRNAGEPANRRS